MPRRKKTEWDKLGDSLKADLVERGSYREGVDDHLIASYVAQAKLVKDLYAEIEGDLVTEGKRQDEPVANPALVRLPSAISGLVQLAKTLGVGPYGRKLTTGSDSKKKPTAQTSAAMLRPINHRKAK